MSAATTSRRIVWPTNEAHKPISQLRSFRAGNMSGRPVGPRDILPSRQWMSVDTHRQMQADAPTYLVFSRNTVIGWISQDGRAVVPDVNYSSSTGSHQSIARTGLTKALGVAGKWIEGELVADDVTVRITARPYRSRVDSPRVTLGTCPAGEIYDVQQAAYHYNRNEPGEMPSPWAREHALISQRWSDVRAERI